MDIEQATRNALTAILDADTGIQAITGRSGSKPNNCIPFRTGKAAEQLPVLLLAFISMPEIGGAGDNRQPTYQITAIAKGNGADAKANALIERVELAVTQPALAAEGIDGFVLRRSRRRIPPENVNGIEGRADIDLTLVVTKH